MQYICLGDVKEPASSIILDENSIRNTSVIV